MIELYFIFNGYRRSRIGTFHHIHQAIKALQEHQATYPEIHNPYFAKSMSGEKIRIDYGAKDCYYLITKGER